MTIAEQFPLTCAALSALPDGDSILAHVTQLEEGFLRRPAISISHDGPGPGDVPPQYDVALAGGGLSLIYAAWLQRAGFKVVVFDRRRIGSGHREWNISQAELLPLTAAGLFTEEQVAELVRMRYRGGVCRFHGGGAYPVDGVLDCVVDAEALLAALRRMAVEAGAVLLDHHRLLGYRTGPGGVAVTLERLPIGEARAGYAELSARLLLDGMGAQSPHARFDLCCPTVGGVMEGVPLGQDAAGLDPGLGEILVTTEGVEEGRQHIWEGFPAPGGRMTIYLFYYAEPAALGPHPLLALYERFFTTLPRYKRGAPRMVRATYGFIPAYTRLRRMPVAPGARVLLIGDAASRHSPLTFCGFGSMIRSFYPVGQGIAACLWEDRLDRRSLARVWAEPRALQVLGGLALLMAQRRRRGPLQRLLGQGAADPAAVNRLLDAAFASLSGLGQERYAALLRDEIGGADFVRFMRGAAARYPAVYRDVFRGLGVGEVARWLARLASLLWHER